ncbi:MAG TPA: hypothetical protein PK544_13450 [Spirochaetota bacterium]|nr:hypothetical protein [Spirochaetota bacterium]HPQ53588.1 hypothetical protein [Spirochaetota bacterium]
MSKPFTLKIFAVLLLLFSITASGCFSDESDDFIGDFEIDVQFPANMAGETLYAAVYYSMPSTSSTPDKQSTYTIPTNDAGYHTFSFLDVTSESVYAGAFIDENSNGIPGIGEYGEFYNNQYQVSTFSPTPVQLSSDSISSVLITIANRIGF